MLDRGGNNLDNDDIIGVMAAAPMIDNDNQPAPENLPSTEDSRACGPTAAFANGMQQSNGMSSQNLPSGHHRCPTCRTSTCLKGCFSHCLSKQQSSPNQPKPSPW